MMTPNDFIVNVSETDFEYEVLSYSQNVPVVVEFWATWCQPCKRLEPILEQLTKEAQGSFRLARVDVDANPNLALRYGVRSVPTVKAVSQGQVVGEFTGLQPEARIRDFFSKLLPPSESSLKLEKANSLLRSHDWMAAEDLFRSLEDEPQIQPQIKLGLLKTLLAQGNSGEALFLLNNFPASREFNAGQIMRPLVETMVKYEKDELPQETDLDAMFSNSIRLVRRGNHLAALDGLLEILKQDKRFGHDKARLVFVAILELLGETDPDANQYRRELAMVLF